MIKVGITGTIGSGKTIVCKAFESLGIPVYYADIEAKKFYKEEKVIERMKKELGDSVFSEEGVIDHKKLAKKIFSDSIALQKTNNIIHPLVKDDFNSWVQQQERADYILYESALLFESGFYKDYDTHINVSAPRALCISRVINRDGVSKEQVIARMDKQFSNEKKSELADHIILNDDKHLVIPQVLMLHERFSGEY
jgi:dephospho-CoA kinase